MDSEENNTVAHDPELAEGQKMSEPAPVSSTSLNSSDTVTAGATPPRAAKKKKKNATTLDSSTASTPTQNNNASSSPNADGGEKKNESDNVTVGEMLAFIWDVLKYLWEQTLIFLAWAWLQTRMFNHYILTSPTEVFGAAPSLSSMVAINKNAKGSHPFKFPWFWYHFRLYFPYVYPVVILIFMIIAISGWDTIEGHLVLGSALSLFGSLSVVLSYYSIHSWRKHPSTLIIYRALSTVFFSINIIDEANMENRTVGTFYSCRTYAFFTHFALLVGECWLTSIASDLVNSLTNPFSSYQASMKRYLLYTNVFAFTISVIFYNDDTCQGNFSQGICWIKFDSINSGCLWGYYLVWIFLMYAYQIYAVLFSYFRLKRGLDETFQIRKQTAELTFKCLMAYAIYLFVVGIFFWVILSSDGSSKSLYYFFLFIIANRGSVDAFVWFTVSDFERDGFPFVDDAAIHLQSLYSPLKKVGQELKETLTLEGLKNLKDAFQDNIEEIHNVVANDFDETDLSPQVNLALRKQVIEYVTKGVRDSITRENLCLEKKSDFSTLESLFNSLNPVPDPADLPGQGTVVFYLDGEHCFKSYADGVFSQLRSYEGITDEKYIGLMSKPTKERLSEGASGAFMFFCGTGEFIVKTIRDREAKVLHESISKFNDYIKENPRSFLCRFLGSYSLQMYEQTFYFVVMLNCFDPEAKVNERYDIKGSWVGRSADPVQQTKKTVCRHCNTYFVPNQHEQCKIVVGYHEPNVVLKDNDLRTRLFLNKEDTERCMETLKNDSELLGELGVLDYSLIIGVKKHKFDVDISEDMMGIPLRMEGEKSIGDHVIFKSKSVVGTAVFHLGVIDFLQNWTFMKRVERFFKIYILRKDPDGLSVMQPDYYMLRFQKKMEVLFDKSVLNDSNEASASDKDGENSSLLVTHFSKRQSQHEMAQVAVKRRTLSQATKFAAIDDPEFNPLGLSENSFSIRDDSSKGSLLNTILEEGAGRFLSDSESVGAGVKVSDHVGKYQQFEDVDLGDDA